MARPTTFTQKLGKRICELISDGASLRSIGEMPTMPSRRTMRTWLGRFPEFEADYERARRHRADNLVDEIVELSDSVKGSDSAAEVNAARLAVETRKWIAGKILPQYGDKLSAEITGANGRDLIPSETDSEKLALALLVVLRGGKNDPASLAPLPAMATGATTTLLSASVEHPEPLPAQPAAGPPRVPEPLTRLGDHPIFDHRTGELKRPLFDVASGRLLRFVGAGGEQG